MTLRLLVLEVLELKSQGWRRTPSMTDYYR